MENVASELWPESEYRDNCISLLPEAIIDPKIGIASLTNSGLRGNLPFGL